MQVAGGIFNRNIVGHYTQALRELRQRGLYATLQESSAPYVEAVWNNFAGKKETWTEEFVTGRAPGKLYRKIAGWFGRK